MRARAKRLGWDERLTPEQEFDLDPYDRGDDDLVGKLVRFRSRPRPGFPGVEVVLVGGQEADPKTVEPLEGK